MRHGNATQRICHAQVAAAGAAWLRPPPRCRRPPSGGTSGMRRTNVRSARAGHGGGASSGLSVAAWLGVGGMGRGGGGVGHVQAAIVDDAGRVVVAARDAHGLAAHGLAALLLALLAACRGVSAAALCGNAATLRAVCCTAALVDGARCTLQRCAARCNGVVHVATLRDVYCTLHAALPFAALPRAPPAQRSASACLCCGLRVQH